MLCDKKILLILRYIDYLYISNYVKNCSIETTSNKCMNEWKIFSTRSNSNRLYSNDKHFNILYLIQSILYRNKFDFEILLTCIYIYKKICIYNAHIIENYVYLFGSVYLVVNNILCDDYLSNNFLSDIFNIESKDINEMIKCVYKFIEFNDAYFGVDEKKNILSEISITDI